MIITFPRWPRKVIIQTVILSGIVIVLIHHSSWHLTSTPQLLQATIPEGYSTVQPGQAHELKLIIPATKVDSLICKTLVSADILEYPPPLLVNFGKTFEQLKTETKDGTHLAKIPGILSQLQSLGEDDDQQLVLAIDGLDTWFQLGPPVLISRYHAIIQRALERTSFNLCGRNSCVGIHDLAHVNQQIVFGAQKRCWPVKDGDLDISCLALPPSTLPEDIFGADTDKPWPDEDYPWMKMRQAYLNSGFMIGPAAAVRRLLEEAERRMHKNLYNGSDQAIFVEIFGEQEYARRLLRATHLRQQPLISRLWRRLFASPTEYDNVLPPIPPEQLPSSHLDDTTGLQNLEHGISLDYFSELTHTTVFAHRDADWIVHNRLDLPTAFWQTKPPASTEFSIPDDVATYLQQETQSHPSDLPVYTNLYTGIVPTSIHHNAYQHGMKTLLWSMWPHMWYHNKTLSFINKVDSEADESQVTTIDQDQDQDHRYASQPNTALSDRHTVQLDNGTTTTLHQLCGEFYDTFDLEVHGADPSNF